MPGDLVTLVDRDNNAVNVDIDKAGQMLQSGMYRLQTADDRTSRAAQAAEDDLYGGAAGTVLATGAGIARGATGGLSDAALSAMGAGDQLRKLQEHHGIASVGGEIVGAVSPLGVGGAFGRAGAAVARGIGEGSAVARIVGAGAGAATEGALFGAGSGVSELALSDDPVTLERAASVIGSKALFGAAVGGAAGTLTKSVEVGLLKAKSSLDDIGREAATVEHDLVGKSPSELSAMHEAEVASLGQQQVARRSSAVDDLIAYRKQLREANPYLVADDQGAAQLAGADAQFRKALDAPKALRSNPSQLSRSLEKQEQALERTIAEREALAAKFEQTNAKIVEELKQKLAEAPIEAAAQIELSGKAMKRYAAATDTKVARKATSLTVSRDAVEDFVNKVQSGAIKGSAETSLGKLDGLLEANRALQQKIETAKLPKSELTSPRLNAIKTAKAEAEAQLSRKPGLVEQVAQGSVFGHVAGLFSGVPVLGPLAGAKVAKAATDLVFGRLGKATAEVADRTNKAIDAFVSVSRAAQKPTPVLASKVLARVAYAPSKAANDNKSLPALFKQRSQEIRSQMMAAADGSMVMRPEARQAMAEQLKAVRAVAPLVADKLETIAARRLEFLASKLPRKPSIGGLPLGPDQWQPSDLEMRTFARYAAAVEDPAGIVERLSHGTITPEDSEALRAVYPETFEAIKARIIESLPALTKALPYERRVALSIFSGVPVDPAMRPEILAVLQGQFEDEQGTEGGTQAPPANPQFGSISKSTPEPTPAQSRAG